MKLDSEIFSKELALLKNKTVTLSKKIQEKEWPLIRQKTTKLVNQTKKFTVQKSKNIYHISKKTLDRTIIDLSKRCKKK